MSFSDNKQSKSLIFLPCLLIGALLFSGCAALLIAGGAAGGYAIAKTMDNKPLVDTKKK